MEKDVPSPIDFSDAKDVRAWIEETERKRPWRPEFFREFTRQVAEYCPASATILELGAGPGMLAQHILETCSVRRYVLLDFSSPMLGLAQQRLKAFDGVTDYVKRDFRTRDWEEGLGVFDACVTMQAVHEVRHKKYVPQLLVQISRIVKPGGYLWVADHYFTDQNNPDLYLTAEEQPATLRAAGFPDVTLVLDKGNMALYRCRCTPNKTLGGLGGN